ncbi:MAG: hypothetical protein QNJ51_08515 [Calothrix sp. MO_167.B12]|nr:hypothetical protein [Calothrix sp. MO_167.B12]
MPKSKFFKSSFNYQDVYPCPLCRVGTLTHMTLMEAMSCDFCQQIFTADIEEQQIKMPSRQPPLVWHWNGFHWTEAQLEGVELGWGYAVAALGFIFLPTTLIGSIAYHFPPKVDVPWTWIPYIWAGLTFFSHFVIIFWLVLEIYQIPVMAYWRAIQQRLISN